MAGRGLRGRAARRTRAAIGHALAFPTWRSLTRDQGLAENDAVALMRVLVDAPAVYSAAIVMLRPADLADGERVLRAREEQLGRLLAVPARDAGRGGLPARGGLADAVEHVARLAEPAARQDDRRTPCRRGARGSRPRAARRASATPHSLIRRSPSRSPRSMLNAPMWSMSSTAIVSGASERRVRASSRGSSSSHMRRVARPVSGSVNDSAGEALAQRRVLDRHRGLRGEQPQHAAGRVGQRLERDAPDHDQHAGDHAVAQHRLEHRRAGVGGLHERRGERRVVRASATK